MRTIQLNSSEFDTDIYEKFHCSVSCMWFYRLFESILQRIVINIITINYSYYETVMGSICYSSFLHSIWNLFLINLY